MAIDFKTQTALVSLATFLWSRQIKLRDARPTPMLVSVSFGIFVISLLLAGGALIMQILVFPWKLDPKSSVMFGCIFLGDAFYFLYGLYYPRWHNALGQLLSFLAYDLVLIFPFLLLFKTIKPEFRLSLVVYVSILIYSAALAIYYIFINQRTRILESKQALSFFLCLPGIYLSHPQRENSVILVKLCDLCDFKPFSLIFSPQKIMWSVRLCGFLFIDP